MLTADLSPTHPLALTPSGRRRQPSSHRSGHAANHAPATPIIWQMPCEGGSVRSDRITTGRLREG